MTHENNEVKRTSTRFAANSKNSLFNSKLGFNMYNSDKTSAKKMVS